MSSEFIKGVAVGMVAAVVTFILMAAMARAEPKTVLVLDREISAYSIAPLTDVLRKVAVEKQKTDVVILISSPGGEVDAGMSFINLMDAVKAQGNRVTCYVQDVAASMAFQILTRCNVRYALPTSQMLWHGVRIQTSETITAERAHQFQMELDQINESFKYQLYPTLHMSRAQIDKSFLDETLWSGTALRQVAPKFIQLLPSYPDLWPLTVTGTHMAENSINKIFSDYEERESDGKSRVIYLWTEYQQRGTQ